MPSRSRAIERNQTLLESAESRAARQVAQAYNQARRELVANLLERWTGNVTLSPNQAADLLRRLGILENIDSRLLQLEREVGVILRDVVTGGTELAIEQIARELALLPVDLRPSVGQFSMLDTELVDRFIPIVTEEMHGVTQATLAQLRRELQSGLLQGESFPNLVQRLMAPTPSGEGPALWRNGQLAAERMIRRTVITANNMSKQSALEKVNAAGTVQVRKQWMASIGPRTTNCCLRAHGQIVDVDQPFTLTGTPRFAREMLSPPGHWNCRSSIVMWHESFEQGALPTSKLRDDARAEIARRDRAS